jgi:hypothetical protein
MDEIVAVLYIDETSGRPLEIHRSVEDLINAHPFGTDWSERSTTVITRSAFNKIKELANE